MARTRSLFAWFALGPGPGDRRGRLFPAGSGGADVDQHLFLERHHRAGGGRREHAAAAAACSWWWRCCSPPLAQPMGKQLEGLPPLKGYGVNLRRQRRRRRRVRADVVARVAADGLVRASPSRSRSLLVDAPDGPGRPAGDDRPARRIAASSCTACRGGSRGRRTTGSRSSRKGRRPSSRSTTSSTSRWPRWPARNTSTSGRTRRSATGFEDVLILGAGSGTDVAASLLHGTKHIDAVEIDPVIVRLGREHHPDQPYNDPRVNVVTDDARHFLRTTTEEIRPGGVRADRFADGAIELLRRAARELHVHRGVVPRRRGSP